MNRCNFPGLTALFTAVPVAAALAGPPSDVPVTVTNPVLPVEVLNADPLPVRIEVSGDNPARQAFAADASLSINAVSIDDTETVLTVPSDKRAVLESLSCRGRIDAGNTFVQVTMEYGLNGALHYMNFGFTRLGAGFPNLQPDGSAFPTEAVAFNQPIRAYADGGTAVRIIVLRNYAVPSLDAVAAVSCSLTGHFVDMG